MLRRSFGFCFLFFMAISASSAEDMRIPGEYLIELKVPGKEGLEKVRSSLAKTFGKTNIKELRLFQTDQRLAKIKVLEDTSTESISSFLQNHPAIQHFEPNYRVKITALPNDTDFGKLWGLHNTGQTDGEDLGRAGRDISAVAVWDQGYKGSRKVLVAVIDTGIDLEHPDLKENLYTNPGEKGSLANNGIDDDGNGFIDDYMGWNFVGKNNNPQDDHNHGTHCSGTIGASGNNGIGVVGVNWEVSLLPVKFLSDKGSGTTEDAIESVKYATLMKADITNNSWGGDDYSKLLEDAIAEARDAGILFVAAAGNDWGSDNDVTPHYPSNYDLENVISVAASTNWDWFAWFSNIGATTVDIAAPGYNILSSVTCTRDLQGVCKTPLVKYDVFSGTSMAAPHVAGAAALLKSLNPGWTYSELKARMMDTAEPVRIFDGDIVSGGRLDLESAVRGWRLPDPGPGASEWVDVPYSLESAHPYVNKFKENITIHVPGAKYMRIVFDELELEDNWDYITLSDANGLVFDEFDGAGKGIATKAVAGDTIQFQFSSDTEKTFYGYLISRVQVVK